MIKPAELIQLAAEVQKLNGLPKAVADRYTGLCASAPELSEDGQLVVVRDPDGQELARIKWPGVPFEQT